MEKGQFKFLNTIEGTIAFLVIVGVAGLTTFSVLILNPRRSGSDVQVSSDNTVNAVTLDDASITPLTFENKYESSEQNVIFKQDGRSANYQIEIKSMEEGESTKDLMNIINPNDKNVRISITNNIKGNILDVIDLDLIYDTNNLSLYSNDNGALDQSIVVLPNSNSTLQLKLEATTRINFPFTIELLFE